MVYKFKDPRSINGDGESIIKRFMEMYSKIKLFKEENFRVKQRNEDTI